MRLRLAFEQSVWYNPERVQFTITANAMEASKSTKKKKTKSGGGGVQHFFVWHGEKIAVAAVVIVTIGLVMHGLGFFGQAVPWQPDDLERVATDAETAIRNSGRSAEDEGVEMFDFAAHAEHIKELVPTAPYRVMSPWNPEQRWRPPPPGAVAPRVAPVPVDVQDELDDFNFPEGEQLEGDAPE
ncbi:MAG: hypothetical protein FWG73_07545 [Planctomycetaceae bacterium]|nr:hypothetical protein [Planctomycetaceae bacterium]